ncbi:helicase-associated domain-containing protein [Streptacidiphilus sp. P02-A3a]|uniref:helicase-associated domain-containing protein n=1 Tax=Streptacidiphilus sp. P02-A3a TaxID=2704468 RepID=UPI0015FACE74|nr:helicase-associated domain-containing protein [Streptacidiphilus sp. P02-A3a]QMU72757.1 helicase-associated domain-containing protein [Streptacidiphilus sp. P02-A3a]
MKSSTALRNRLAQLSPGELAALLRARRVGAATARNGSEPRSLAQLAEHLLEDRSVADAVSRLSLPGLQVLSAAVWLASQTHGAPAPGPYWTPLEPSARTLPEAGLLELLSGGDAALRAAAERELAALRARLLVLPAAGGELALPAFVHRHLSDGLGLGRPVAQLMTDAFNAPEVHRIAAGLDLPGDRDRATAQAAVVELLGDGEQLRALLATAPPAAAELLARLAAGPPLLRTHCFLPLGGYHYGPGTKYQLRPGGSGDPGTDWLAAHGLLVPVAADLAELPFEVVDALTGGRVNAPFDPEPPRLRAEPVPDVSREAQAAAATASRRVELLLAACAAVPPTVRKVGGLAVRDTRRLAKAIGAAEEQTRLWIDLGYHADLLGIREPEPERSAGRGRGRRPAAPAEPVRLLPTTRYDDWQTRSPADRLVPVICAWAVVPEVLSWWPEYREETPVALVAPQDVEAVPLRRQLLAALATLPPGTGLGPAAALGGRALRELVGLVGWLRPGLVGSDPDAADPDTAGRVLATLREAELLGAVAHGRLTALGEAVLALLDGDAADSFPYVPGSVPGPDQADAADVSADDVAADDPGAADAGTLATLRAALAELLPPPRTTARFQADLTAIAAGAPSAELAELLGSAADRESEGHAVVWRFGAASVRRALDAGSSAQELLARLSEVAEGGLPQPLEYLVRDTGRTHGHIRVVRSACCVRSDDESLVLELSRTRALARLELRRIAPTVLISTASPAATLEALRAAGFAPVLEAETGVTLVERAPELRAEERMPAYHRMRGERRRSPADPRALAARLLGEG